MLAYVRKDDDAIPDYLPSGFMDDQQEVRAAAMELGPLLQAFKAWRLCHLVPAWGARCPARAHGPEDGLMTALTSWRPNRNAGVAG